MNLPTRSTQIRPMLAHDVCLNDLHGELIVQPKLDGVRAFWDANTQCMHTRNGRVITSLDHIVAEIFALGLSTHNLDGEIYTTDLPFETINGLVRKHQPCAETERLQFHVFDVIDDTAPAKNRARFVSHLPASEIIKPVSTFFTAHTELNDYYQCFLDSGCEGIIVRAPNATYQQGRRGPALGRIKPVMDVEATLVGFAASKSARYRETFGALVLKLPNGKTFKCSGMSDAQRREMWRQQPLGVSVTVQFKGYTPNGLPREPSFKSIRTDLNTTGVAA